MSTRWTVTFDCAQPTALAAFWRLALGYAEGSPPAGFASWPEWFAHMGVPPEEWDDGAYIEDPDGIGPAISFLKVPEPKVAKNRVHLDVQAGGGREQPWQIRWPLVKGGRRAPDRRRCDRDPRGDARRHARPYRDG
jgi:Glyoxalase-like domain